MKKLLMVVLGLMLLTVAACTAVAPPPAATEPPPPTATPPPMADKLIVYGDTVYFVGGDDPNSCIEKSRYTHGQPVGFRMTAIDPMTGNYIESGEVVVHITYGGKTEDVPMRYRGSGEHPHPGMWTAKWVVPDDAPVGIVEYTVTATDDQGRTGEFKPFDVDSSKLAIVESE